MTPKIHNEKIDQCLQECKEAGLRIACKKYIELMVKDSPEGHSREDRARSLQWKWEYEDEASEEVIGASVGIWFGMIGDQHWDSWEYFSISASSDYKAPA